MAISSQKEKRDEEVGSNPTQGNAGKKMALSLPMVWSAAPKKPRSCYVPQIIPYNFKDVDINMVATFQEANLNLQEERLHVDKFEALVDVACHRLLEDFPVPDAANKRKGRTRPLLAKKRARTSDKIEAGMSTDKTKLGEEEPWRAVVGQMGGGKLMRIGEKTLFNSDKSEQQARLLLTQGIKEQIYKYLTQEEKNDIHSEPEMRKVGIKPVKGLQVEVLDYLGRRYEMKCKYRRSQNAMVFNGRGWGSFLKNHAGEWTQLTVDDAADSLLIYVFRPLNVGRICFVFVLRK